MSQHAVSKEHLIEIGNITVFFALMENELKSLFSELTQLKDNQKKRLSIIIASELSIRQLFQLVKSLFVEVYGENAFFSELIEIIKKAEKATEKRNLITHSIWGAGKNNSLIRIKIINKNKGTDFQAEPFSVGDFANIAKQIDDVYIELRNFRIKAFFH